MAPTDEPFPTTPVNPTSITQASMRQASTALLCFSLVVVAGCDSGGGLDTSGELVVEDLSIGSGASVADGDAVMIAYSGALEDGTVFEVSDNMRPLAFVVGAGQVVEGLELGMIGMMVGGTRRITIPPRLGYGADGVCSGSNCPVPGNATIVFDVTLIRVLDDVYIESDVPGSGTVAEEGMIVVFHYTATLSNGTIVGTSTTYNSPLSTVLGSGDLVEGLDRGLVGMQPGGTRVLVVPPDLAFGAEGNGQLVPPNAILRYTVSVLVVDTGG